MKAGIRAVFFSACIGILQPVLGFWNPTTSSILVHRNMVSLHGRTTLVSKRGMTAGMHRIMGERPPDPNSLLSQQQLQEKAQQLTDWWQGKQNVFCITGAGLSTDSGIPDYRGNNGSYHKGHKPIIHQQYMDSEFQRKRYWGRSMVGWKGFDLAQPNKGHVALADLERMKYLGVSMRDRPEFYESHDVDAFYMRSTGERTLSIVTQNVDSLHQRAGSKEVTHLHGRGSLLKCMQCGKRHNRNEFHHHLEENNRSWLKEAKEGYEELTEMRPDGDAQVKNIDYNHVHVPNCPHCKSGFFKPDVVFFGDTVPKNRVVLCQSAVEEADGILVVGTSLAVHSAYRHIRAANSKGTPIAILNVGETRAEAEGLGNILKIEAPASDTLSLCVDNFAGEKAVVCDVQVQ